MSGRKLCYAGNALALASRSLLLVEYSQFLKPFETCSELHHSIDYNQLFDQEVQSS